MTSSQSSLIALSGEIRWRTRSTKISPPPPGMEPKSRRLEIGDDRFQRFVENFAKMDEFAGAEAVDIEIREFAFDVGQQIEIPLFGQFGMMAALHQHLRAAQRDGFLDFFVQFRRAR